ncbi:aldo/keto reductase [Steroidobacter flavus]|uniref:Aldo/keto reductase n=1 Tax=Steroidobacter flavus TaxID=1842136 RepID=A0ABV8T134_9GAMM
MKLALGTVQFGLAYGVANQQGQVRPEEAQQILRLASASGVDTLDTAVAYGNSEQCLGDIGVTGWRVVSKLPAVPDDCVDVTRWVRETLGASLRRLRTDRLYALLLHRPQQLLADRIGPALFAALRQLKAEGLVTKIGVSVYGPEELTELCGRFELDLVQAPFNIVDRRLLDSGWLSRLSRAGVEVHVRSVFLQGLLLMEANRPPRFDRWRDLWTRWHAWLADTRLTAVEACMRYALSHEDIAHVVVGVDSAAQLQQILAASRGTLPEIPAALACDDPDLINPSRWSTA